MTTVQDNTKFKKKIINHNNSLFLDLNKLKIG